MTLPASMREAKQVSIYLCRDHTGMTLQQIAEAFDRTYEDAIHACKVVSDRMRSEPEFRERVGRVFHQLACVKRQEGFFSGVESPELSTPECSSRKEASMNQAEERQTKPAINTIQATRSDIAFTDVSQHVGPQVLAVTAIKIIYEDRKRFSIDRVLKGTLLGFGDDFFVMQDWESYLIYDASGGILAHVPVSMGTFDGCNPHGFCVKLGDGTMVTFNKFGQRTGN